MEKAKLVARPQKRNRAPRRTALMDAISIADRRAMALANIILQFDPSEREAIAGYRAAMLEAEHIANAIRRLIGEAPRYPASRRFVVFPAEEKREEAAA